MKQELALSTTLADLFPSGTVLMPRGAADAICWVHEEAYRADTATGVYLAIMGDMPLVCHRNAATPLIQEFFREAGVQPAVNLDTYTTEEEAVAVAREHIRRGRKLAFLYPPPPVLESDESLFMPLSLYHWLNDKSNQAELVDAEHMPRHQVFTPRSASRLLDFMPDQAVFVKVCREGVSGGGSDVFYCRKGDSRAAALDWIRTRGDALTGVRVEKALDIPTCWCVNVAMVERGVTYIGAASQLFSAPARQCGSRIDPGDGPPPEVVDIACSIAERARSLGCRGIAGFDIGVSDSGRPCVFDLNFRAVSCTPQVLLHRAAVDRAGASISQSWNTTVAGSLGPAFERIVGFASHGAFVPVRLYEATPGSAETSMITGIVVGRTLAEIEATEVAINEALGDLIPQASACSQASLSFSPSEHPTAAGPACS